MGLSIRYSAPEVEGLHSIVKCPRQVFEMFLTSYFVPALRPDDIILLDNLGSHIEPTAYQSDG